MDRQELPSVLTQKQNRYLARKLCWVLTVEGLETYILGSRDPADLDLLIEAVRPAPRPTGPLPQIRLTSGFRAISSNYDATDVRQYGPTASQCFSVRIAAVSLAPITISTRSGARSKDPSYRLVR